MVWLGLFGFISFFAGIGLLVYGILKHTEERKEHNSKLCHLPSQPIIAACYTLAPIFFIIGLIFIFIVLGNAVNVDPGM